MPVNHFVADLAALKAIPASSVRADGYLKLVLTPATGEMPTWYTYVEDSALGAFGTIVILPDDNPVAGRWHKLSNLVFYSTGKPSSAPPLKGITWVATLSTPTRRVTFLSIDTSSVADWIPFGNPVYSGESAPTFTPDYVGQLFSDIVNDTLWVSENTTSSSDWSERVSGSGGGGGS